MTKFKTEFPDHHGAKVAKVESVKNKLGTFTIGVLAVGKDWHGKTEYEIEVKYPGEGNGTSTKKFSSISEAVAYAKKGITEEVSKHDEAKKKTKAKKTPAKKDLLEVAEERGWTFEWHQEQEDWSSFLGEEDKIEDIESVEYVVLKDSTGRVLESLGGITFAKGSPTHENQNYGREIERELVNEAIYAQEHGR